MKEVDKVSAFVWCVHIINRFIEKINTGWQVLRKKQRQSYDEQMGIPLIESPLDRIKG